MRGRRSESGAMAVLVAFLAIVLIGVLAFVTDFGFAYANQRSLQNASDAAVLAAGQRIIRESLPGQTCAQLKANAPAAVQSDGSGAFASNAGSGAALPASGVTVDCNDPVLPDRVVITAQGSQDSASFFGRIFGHSHYSLDQSARAVIGPAQTLLGVRPFALCDGLGDIAFSQPNAYVTVNFTNADQGCGAAAGNFGMLDMRNAYTPPAGPAVPGCPGVATVGPWISDGYPNEIPVSSPLYVQGKPGIPANGYESYFSPILDQPIVIPTYDGMTDSGCNSVYHITGFIEAKVCGYKLTSGVGARVEGSCFSSPSAPVDNNDRFVQLRFSRFLPVGNIDINCKINAPCDHGPKVLKLAQ